MDVGLAWREGEGYVQRFWWSACVGKGWLPLWSEHVGPAGWLRLTLPFYGKSEAALPGVDGIPKNRLDSWSA